MTQKHFVTFVPKSGLLLARVSEKKSGDTATQRHSDTTIKRKWRVITYSSITLKMHNTHRPHRSPHNHSIHILCMIDWCCVFAIDIYNFPKLPLPTVLDNDDISMVHGWRHGGRSGINYTVTRFMIPQHILLTFLPTKYLTVSHYLYDITMINSDFHTRLNPWRRSAKTSWCL